MKIDKDFIGPFIGVENSEIAKNVIMIDNLDCTGQSQEVSLLQVEPYMPPTALAILESDDSYPPKLENDSENL
uniref:Uncharacterized protein n=1 Tax=Romanomermis culicivorax TaxID=13658 RepID=A0A915KZN3_ROMCU